MKPKSLGILAVVTLVFVALAWNASGTAQSGSRLQEEALAAYPSFADRVNEVVELEIVGHDARFTVKQTDGAWGLVEKSGYPVDFERVRDVVVRLSELEPLEAKTRRPDRFALMGVEDPSQEGSSAKRVVLRNAQGETLCDMIVGDTKFKGRTATVFVRPADRDQAYQCEGRVTFEADPLNWIDREVLKLANGKVKSLVIEHHDGEVVRIERVGDSRDYALQDVPAGRQPSHQAVANAPATALSFLRLDDVRPRGAVDFTVGPRCKATYACDDGLVLTVELAEVEGATWARLNAAFAPPAEGAEGADPEQATHAEVEARALQRTFERWAYQLPDFKADAIAKRAADLLIDAPAEEPEAAPETAPTEEPPAGLDEPDTAPTENDPSPRDSDQ